jgi:hypothetical protein
MQLVGKRSLDKVEYATSHRIIIRADPSNIPAFSRAFRYNRPEARIIAQLAGEYKPDVIVTPFEAQANKIRTFLDDEGLSVPVKLPQQLDGTIEGRAIVSITVADGILSPPMTDPEILYSLFTAAEDLLIVGDEQTLRSKDAIRRLVVESATEYHYDPSNTGAAD